MMSRTVVAPKSSANPDGRLPGSIRGFAPTNLALAERFARRGGRFGEVVSMVVSGQVATRTLTIHDTPRQFA
jgi:hypothetical protein